MSLLDIVTKIAKRPLEPDELDEIETFAEKISKTDEFMADIKSGKLLKQGKIPGSYNGYICAKCSYNRAKWDCPKCGKYYCLDHQPNDLCSDCSPRCTACEKKKTESKLKFCPSCDYYLCVKCDSNFWETTNTICSECSLDDKQSTIE
jgi:hypothetical protein